MSTQPIRVIVVDDSIIYRKGLSGILQRLPNLQVVAEAENGRSAIEAVERLRPDVVLMDYSMPVLNGLEATREIKARFPDVKVILLTIYDDQETTVAAIKAGASDFVCKDCSIHEIIQAVVNAGTRAGGEDVSV